MALQVYLTPSAEIVGCVREPLIFRQDANKFRKIYREYLVISTYLHLRARACTLTHIHAGTRTRNSCFVSFLPFCFFPIFRLYLPFSVFLIVISISGARFLVNRHSSLFFSPLSLYRYLSPTPFLAAPSIFLPPSFRIPSFFFFFFHRFVSHYYHILFFTPFYHYPYGFFCFVLC